MNDLARAPRLVGRASRSAACGAGLVALALVLGGAGCGSASKAGFSPGDAGEASDALAPSDGATADDILSLGEAGGDAGAMGNAEVFGESPDTLYKLDPDTKGVTAIGAFQGCSQVIDIALDKDSNMYGTTLYGLYRVDRTTAKCTLIASGNYPNSLSFVPAGTLDPNVEALVGYEGDVYIRIDPMSGKVSRLASIGQGYASSGDIVSVKGGGTYLTVTGGPNLCNDCLIQVDPATGAFVKDWGPVQHPGVYGLAFWAGSLYGFDNGGQLFEIDFNGAAMQITPIPVPNPPPLLQFWGAGSTTSAPPSANH